MKRILIISTIVLALLCSCIAEPSQKDVGNYISVTNHANVTIWYQIRKASDPASDVYNSVYRSGYAFVSTEQGTEYRILFCTIEGEHEEIRGGELVKIKVMSTPIQIDITTTADRNEITFTQDSNGIHWTIEH